MVCAPFFSLQSPNPLARSLATLYYDFAPPFEILRDTNARPFRRVIIICRQPRRYSCHAIAMRKRSCHSHLSPVTDERLCERESGLSNRVNYVSLVHGNNARETIVRCNATSIVRNKILYSYLTHIDFEVVDRQSSHYHALLSQLACLQIGS